MSEPVIRWQRTENGDASFDFTAHLGEVCVGRIYQHFDGVRWQWFAYAKDQTSGEAGIANSKDEAQSAIEERAKG